MKTDDLVAALQLIVNKIEANSNAIRALEMAALSEKYTGRQLTPQQLEELREDANSEQEEVYVYLYGVVQKLSSTLREA